jgi:hypothetical protein
MRGARKRIDTPCQSPGADERDTVAALDIKIRTRSLRAHGNSSDDTLSASARRVYSGASRDGAAGQRDHPVRLRPCRAAAKSGPRPAPPWAWTVRENLPGNLQQRRWSVPRGRGDETSAWDPLQVRLH